MLSLLPRQQDERVLAKSHSVDHHQRSNAVFVEIREALGYVKGRELFGRCSFNFFSQNLHETALGRMWETCSLSFHLLRAGTTGIISMGMVGEREVAVSCNRYGLRSSTTFCELRLIDAHHDDELSQFFVLPLSNVLTFQYALRNVPSYKYAFFTNKSSLSSLS